MRRFALISVLWAHAVAQTPAPLPPSGSVTLSLDEYNRLADLAAKPPKKPEGAPYPYVLKAADINLLVNGESVSGSILLEGEVLAKGVRKVPLVSGMTVLDARRRSGQADLTVPLQQEAGVHSAFLSGPAEFAVRLETGLPLAIEPGRAAFTLTVPAAGVARLKLSVPGEQTQVHVNPGLITSRGSTDGRTLIEAALPPGQAATFWWASRLAPAQPATQTKDERFLSEVSTLLSVTESELVFAVLAQINVVRGDPAQFRLRVPEGYELTAATGPTLESSDLSQGHIVLKVRDPAARSHQFLLTLARSNTAAGAEIPLPGFEGTSRETGEALVEAEGAIELKSAGRGGVRRIDIRETGVYLRSLSRSPLHAAFRYQRRPSETPSLGLEWVRFPDGAVLAAVAERAVVTTLVTGEGRSLTEVRLSVKNRTQPFLKVTLPPGASILSATVAGEKVKPVEGQDGNRVPLLRPGFRPERSYEASFVFLQSGAPFPKKGTAALALPKMDIPIALLNWELYLPETFKVGAFGGDTVPARLLRLAGGGGEGAGLNSFVGYGISGTSGRSFPRPGDVVGFVTDPTGAEVPGAEVSLLHLPSGLSLKGLTGPDGGWSAANVPSGQVRLTIKSSGFVNAVREFSHDAHRGTRMNVTLNVGSVTETVEVSASSSGRSDPRRDRSAREPVSNRIALPSNVQDLQRRVAGVLPVAVNIPRTGMSYRFTRPLVLNEETRLTFSYRMAR